MLCEQQELLRNTAILKCCHSLELFNLQVNIQKTVSTPKHNQFSTEALFMHTWELVKFDNRRDSGVKVIGLNRQTTTELSYASVSEAEVRMPRQKFYFRARASIMAIIYYRLPVQQIIENTRFMNVLKLYEWRHKSSCYDAPSLHQMYVENGIRVTRAQVLLAETWQAIGPVDIFALEFDRLQAMLLACFTAAMLQGLRRDFYIGYRFSVNTIPAYQFLYASSYH